MKTEDKTKAMNRMKKRGVSLTILQTNELISIIDDEVWKYRKQNQENKIGTRLIYSVIFAIILIYGWFHSNIGFMLIMAFFLLYNIVHFLSDYVFYHNNFKRNLYDKKD